MSAVLNLRRAAATAFRAEAVLTPVPKRFAGITVYEHAGEFDNVMELKRYVKKFPAICIAVLHMDGKTVGGLPRACVHLGAFILTQDEKPKDEDAEPIRFFGKRDEQAIAIADAVMDYLLRFPTKNFGQEAGGPLNVMARNLYDEKFDALNAACWAVFWEQEVELVTTPTPVLDDFTEVFIEYFVEDEDG